MPAMTDGGRQTTEDGRRGGGFTTTAACGTGVGVGRAVSALYRKHLYIQGEQKGLTADGKPIKGGFSREQVEEVLNSKGELPMHDLLRCRVRYFSDGVVLGSRTFVEDTFQKHKDQFGLKRETGARRMKHGNWGDLFTMRDLRLASISLPSP